MHGYGIAPADLQSAHTSIAIHSATGTRTIDDAIAVFDTTAGGLRLSAPLFTDLADILEQLERGMALVGAESLVSQADLVRLRKWHEGLELGDPQNAATNLGTANLGEGRLLIYPESALAL